MHDHEVAIAAAWAGATVVRERFGSALGRVEKGGGDLATEADLAAERAILDVLRRPPRPIPSPARSSGPTA